MSTVPDRAENGKSSNRSPRKSGTFRSCTKCSPCKICGGHTRCSVLDNAVHFCHERRGMDAPGFRYLKESRCDTWSLYKSDEYDVTPHRDDERPGASPRRQPANRPEKPHNSPEFLSRFSQNIRWHTTDEQLQRLGDRLGVPLDAIRHLGVQYCPEREGDRACYVFWERDATGTKIGRSFRHADGSKKTPYGDHRGLTYSDDWADGDNSAPILIVKGGSDVLAGLTLWLNVIGRPSNSGGVELLAALLAGVAQAGRQIIVMGENDEKPDGRFPGRDGAMSVADRLAELLAVPVNWALPPDGAKDLRSWLNAQQHVDVRDPEGTDELGQKFIASLVLETTAPAEAPRSAEDCTDISLRELCDYFERREADVAARKEALEAALSPEERAAQAAYQEVGQLLYGLWAMNPRPRKPCMTDYRHFAKLVNVRKSVRKK